MRLLSLSLSVVAGVLTAPAARAEPPKPTEANVPYGTHERQVLDFYRAKSDAPTPVAFFVHGGGWGALSKDNVVKLLDVPRLLDGGVSVVAINYRYVHQAKAAGVDPPVKWPLEDAARALQFVRSKAKEWNLDKERVGACGGSAGACSSLWLALHGDMADPKAADPVARESTRLWCAAVVGAQTSLDPKEVREWMPNAVYGGHAFGFRTDGKDKAAEFQMFLDGREKVLKHIREYSPVEHASKDDPPLWLSYSDKGEVKKGDRPDDPTHSALYGLMLREKFAPLGVEVTLTYPGKPEGDYKTATDFFLARLKAPRPKRQPAPRPRAAKPRNILFILVDDQRHDAMSCAGHPFLKTPAADSLAANGVRFANAYVTTSLCSPSRASILTGLYAHSHRVVDNQSGMSDKLVLFNELLKKAGYRTAFVGKWHMGHAGDEPQRGWDHWVSFAGQGSYLPKLPGGGTAKLNVDGKRVDQTKYITDELTDYAVKWLGEQKTDAPWMLYLSHKAAHHDFRPAPRHEGKYAKAEVKPFPTTKGTPKDELRPMWARNQRNSWHGAEYPFHDTAGTADDLYRRYCETLLAVDESTQRLLDHLKGTGRLDDALVIYMGDNGHLWGEHGLIDKRTAYEPSIRVPLLMHCPALLPKG